MWVGPPWYSLMSNRVVLVPVAIFGEIRRRRGSRRRKGDRARAIFSFLAFLAVLLFGALLRRLEGPLERRAHGCLTIESYYSSIPSSPTMRPLICRSSASRATSTALGFTN